MPTSARSAERYWRDALATLKAELEREVAMTSSYEPRGLVDGLAYAESPRWHDGRLWFSHWGYEEVLAVDLDGHCEVVAPGRPGRP